MYISMTEIDPSGTDGRLNQGISSALALMYYDLDESITFFHWYLSMGTNYCSIADIIYNLYSKKVAGIFITDQPEFYF
jgi:hypothetical protein